MLHARDYRILDDYNVPGIALRCPSCAHAGTFDGMGVSEIEVTVQGRVHRGQRGPSTSIYITPRCCPNPSCRAVVYVERTPAYYVHASYPAERLDFDASGVPARIADALSEAIACHSVSAYRASAMMVRLTLEEVCIDQEAGGRTLADRLESLKSKVVLPQGFVDGLDELRVLGNDAAHGEGRVYLEIGQDEAEVAIDFAKEILKSVYQSGSILRRMTALKEKFAQQGTTGKNE